MVGLAESKKGGRVALVIGGILLAADAFGLDLALSPDLALGVPYALVVVLGLWWSDESYIIAAAVLGSALCLLGFYFSAASDPLWMGMVNRGFAIFVIWMVAVLCLLSKRAKLKKREHQSFNESIGQICSEPVTRADESVLYQKILDSLLAFTDSRFGIIYAVLENPKGKPRLEKKAGLAWNPPLQELAGLSSSPSPAEESYNMGPLLDEVLHTGKPLVMKHVSTDLRRHPVASGCPPLESFMGLPFFHEDRLLAVVGVANRIDGYDASSMKYIGPFLSACAVRIHTLKLGQEQFEMEKALKESRGIFQDMEKNAAHLQLKILEKEAQLDQVEEEFIKVKNTLKEQEDRISDLAEGQGKGQEEFNRLQESLNRFQDEKMKTVESLRDKDAQIEKAEQDRNRTAGALWEKEQCLANVLDDMNLVENELREKTESMIRVEDDLKQAQGQLQSRDDRFDAMEARLKKIGEDQQEKERHLERLEAQLLEVEGQLHRAQQALRDRDGLLAGIEQQIRESLQGNRGSSLPTEAERMALERKEKLKAQMEWDLARQQQEKSKDWQGKRPIPRIEFEQQAEEENGKNQSLKRDPGDEDQKVKNRFQRYTRELERSNEDLKEFASIASHDLQEPIRKIIGFGLRLKKDCSPYLDDRGKDYLERMERSAQKMQKFIDDLLQYSKVSATATTWRQQVDLNDVISHVLIVLESRIEQTDPMLEVEPLPVIEADRMQMLQLFQNLIANALKFHKKGEPPVVKINHRLLKNGFHEIRVQDRGIGFDERHLKRIFKPFERLHGRSDYEGTGMGLAICQKIVLRHGGELTAQSSHQEGTTFIITLPARNSGLATRGGEYQDKNSV